ncbi:N-acetylmuramoyl-L-alanine amidase [Ruficoccus amylovorans]|uniref:N-acetylmuramoyl-L-alanine amidase n=1 Tax=Ruficoccus amylovorans TaxID=1804625 RepID=A0A842HAB5_9BACT|nr:LysM peptidoglycan-binding domain-containing protein [Ruficoccus amylovorans]MBC2593230.1 N-acetylmuramoyl-L-alanine amidase [Ruficoccus amylovorans]
MRLPSPTHFSSRRHFLKWALGVGSALVIPASLLGASSSQRTYRVQRGDTLSGIASRFGVRVRDIQRANGLSGDRILAGQSLVIPGDANKQPAAMAPVIAATQKLSVDRSRWQYIVAHHSAIEKGNAAIYGSAHERRGMENGLAYHFVIGNGIDSGDGEIEIGPRWYKQLRGGHVRDSHVNDVGIGICMVGNFENHPPTERQHASFIQLVDYLQKNCVASDYTFTVHKWVDGARHTLCPGKHFPYQEMTQRYRA